MGRPDGVVDAIIRRRVGDLRMIRRMVERQNVSQPREGLAYPSSEKDMEERERIRTFDTVSRVPR